MVNEFHSNGVIPKGCNASFVALIPKVQNPQHINSFRPISLIGCCYKILVKIMSKQLRMLLPEFINGCQSVFLGNINILDSVLIANEVVEEAQEKKKPTLILKVDFEKGYDTIKSGFLIILYVETYGISSKMDEVDEVVFGNNISFSYGLWKSPRRIQYAKGTEAM